MSMDQDDRRKIEGSLQNLLNCLKLLASDPQSQLDALPNFVVVTDELLLIYADLFLLVDQFLENGLIDLNQAKHLRMLAQHATRLTESQDPDIWSNEALFTHPLWSRHREIALEALNSFDGQEGEFTLDWLSYLPIDDDDNA